MTKSQRMLEIEAEAKALFAQGAIVAEDGFDAIEYQQLGTVDSSSTLPASDPNAAENRALLPAQEYVAWIAAGISPELLTFPVKEMGAMLQAIPKEYVWLKGATK